MLICPGYVLYLSLLIQPGAGRFENNPPQHTPTATVNRTADFQAWKIVVTKSGEEKARSGEELTYIIYVRNTGSVPLSSLTVTDPVPEHTAFISIADGGTYNMGANSVSWVVNDLAAGATATMRFVVTVDNHLEGVKEISNIALVSDGVNTVPTAGCDPAAPGCSGQPGTLIATDGAPDDLFIANTITPNGDGKNDYFIIKGLEKYPGSALYIFNRWGGMVYRSNDYRNNWTGAGLGEGTYYYKLETKQARGTKTYKGWVVIIR